MRLLAMCAIAALAMGCNGETTGGALAGGCDARAVSTWNAGEAAFSIEAAAQGPDCARAVATLVVRDGSGAPQFAEVYQAQHVMTLASATDAETMQTALDEWINATPDTLETTAALPAWAANADAPSDGEFPFFPAEGMAREDYAALRREAAPLYCYVQGMESMNCLAFRDGAVEPVGLQLFPG